LLLKERRRGNDRAVRKQKWTFYRCECFDRGIFAVCAGVVVSACLAPGKSGRGANPWSIAIAAGAIIKAATATPSSMAERSIDVVLTDITGLLVVERLLAMPCMHEFDFVCFFVPSVICLFLP
jgi:hypothetical protein